MIDLAAGRYPRFLFGFGVGKILPVFHFHETTAAALEPAFRHLAENGYRTVASDELAAFVCQGRHPGAHCVMLTFDDAWASLWIVAGPLLKRYGLRAVAYAIPGRVAEADAVRPTIDEGPADAGAADRAPNPFVTWPELRALTASGVVDVQSHTWSHSMIFSGDAPVGVVDPAFADEPWLNRPRLNAGAPPVFLRESQVGYPLFARRSRMSDARRYFPDEAACARVEAFVAERGGAAFFTGPTRQADLKPLLASIPGRWETAAEREAAIEDELVASRAQLSGRLGTPVRHVCVPWGVTGEVTRAALTRLGFLTAFANRLGGRLAVSNGDDPYCLKRLNSRHIFALPGRGRRVLVTLA
jgi:hypothetical protein